jgi:predicted Zn finger-like uncharacterized protein
MALATRCPHCHTTFRVAADQLKLRGGIVRCGTCQQVFDGNAALVDMDAPAPAVPEAPVVPEAPPAPSFPAFLEPEPEFDVLPPAHAPLEYGNGPPAWYSARQARAELPAAPPAPPPAAAWPVIEAAPEHVAPPEPEPEPQPEPEPAPIDVAPIHERVIVLVPEPAPEPAPEPEPAPAWTPSPRRPSARVASNRLRSPAAPVPAPAPDSPPPFAPPVPDSLLDSDDEQYAPLPEQNSLLRMPSAAPRESAGIAYSPAAAQARVRGKKAGRSAPAVPRAAPKPTPPPPARPVDADEPEFIKLGRAREESGRLRTQLTAAGCILLAIVLAVQLFASSRDVLAARYPAIRPLALSLCAAFGCRIQLPAQIDTLAVETGELQTLGNDAYTFTTLLRNQGTLVQAWPNLELTLHDAANKPLVRRIFAPRDYLPTPAQATAGTGFGARTEQPVKLSFRLNGLKPSGYHIAIFYP